MKVILITIAKGIFILCSMLMLFASLISEVLHFRNPVDMWKCCAPEIANIYKELCEEINK